MRDVDFESFEDLTDHYPPTLQAWKDRLCLAVENGIIKMEIRDLRKWIFYFMSYKSAIRAEHVRHGQFLYIKVV